jgi:predicted phage tail protein
MPTEIKKIYPKIIRGAGGSAMGGKSCTPGSPPDPHTPVEAPEGIYITGVKKLSRTETEITDLICEGPIEGLVSGTYSFIGTVGNIGWSNVNFVSYPGNYPYLKSVYWKNIPLLNTAGQYNFSQINFRADYGNQSTAIPLSSNISSSSIPQASRTRTIGDILRYNNPGTRDFIKVYDFRTTNINSLIISMKIESLFDQQNNPNVDVVNYNLGCGSNVKMSSTSGDTRDRSITYTIYIYKITKNGITSITPLTKNVTTTGKITEGIIEKHEFSLTNYFDPNDTSHLGWRIEIERTSKESTVLNLRDSITVNALTEVFQEEYIYPKCAIFKSLFTSEYFSSAPDREYDVKLLKVKIPSNYDPIKKTYSGDWDGRFSDQYHPSGSGLYWTDNPAWCYYDLLTNKRYGLGKYIKNTQVDKWSLYQIGQYCDTIVDDGYGDKEPRFTCNAIINDFSDAYSMLNDFASIFRGMSYYANGSIFAIADTPKNPIILFNNSNVENGDFSYSSSSKKTRNTIAVVRYNDSNNFFKPTVEYVEDPDGIRKYGIRKVELGAFGCTSRGQAYRLGKWALVSEQLETEIVDFVAGYDSLYLKPGDVIKIQDSNRILNRLGGRILNISTGAGGIHNFIIDEEFSNISGYFSSNFANQTYKLEIFTPRYRVTGSTYNDFISGYDKSDIQSGFFNLTSSYLQPAIGYNGDKILTKINCNKVFDATNYNLSTGAIWTCQTTGSGYGLNPETEQYRVISVNELDPNRFSVSAMEYNPSKYLFVESGFTFTDSPTLTPTVYKDASYPSGLSLSLTGDIYIQYKISGAVDTINHQTSNWKVYMKSGTDFNSQDYVTRYVDSNGATVSVPSGSYLIDTLSVNNPFSSGTIVPSINNTNYYFRAYGTNEREYYSNNYASANISYNSIYSTEYTNLLQLDSLSYSSSQDSQTTADLNNFNLIHDNQINYKWNITNLATAIKILVASNLTFRVRLGTGDWANKSFINTQYYEPLDTAENYTISTGYSPNNLSSILTEKVIDRFWFAVDAKIKNGNGKYTSQSTLASPDLYDRTAGYVFGNFKNQKLSLNENYISNGYINLDGNATIILSGAPSNISSLYVFFTNSNSSTGYLTESNLNKIMNLQYSSPYTNFISQLALSGIQLREAFQNGNIFTTVEGFTNTVGGGIIKSGYFAIRAGTNFDKNLIDYYNNDFANATTYGTSSSVEAVNYGSLPSGITQNYRFTTTDNSKNRNAANNLMFLNQINANPIYGTSNGIDLTTNADAFILNKVNNGNLTLGNGYNINVLSGNINITSGTLGITGTTNFLYNTVTNSGVDKIYAPSGYFAINLNGTGVRVPFFKS